MIELPEQWEEMSKCEKDLWFARFALEYSREGETTGLLPDCSEAVVQAWKEFRAE